MVNSKLSLLAMAEATPLMDALSAADKIASGLLLVGPEGGEILAAAPLLFQLMLTAEKNSGKMVLQKDVLWKIGQTITLNIQSPRTITGDGFEAILKFDKASKNNPGRAGAGSCLFIPQKRTMMICTEGFGEASNNVAKYRALIKGLEHFTPEYISGKGRMRDQRKEAGSFSRQRKSKEDVTEPPSYRGKRNLYQLAKEITENTNTRFSSLEETVKEEGNNPPKRGSGHAEKEAKGKLKPGPKKWMKWPKSSRKPARGDSATSRCHSI
eukprot:Gb_27911 [translate_table: standard]